MPRTPRELHERALFLVEVDGFTSASFQKCSALEVEIAGIEYYEGGALLPYKIPGRATFSDITLERGVSSNTDFNQWLLDVVNAAGGGGQGTGLVTPAYLRDIAIVQLRRDRSEARRLNLYEAWPSKYTAGEFDNTVDEVVIEMLTLKFNHFEWQAT